MKGTVVTSTAAGPEAHVSPERRREIRSAAARRAAEELSAVMETGPDSKTWHDWPDPEERQEFEAAMDRIVARLRKEGHPAKELRNADASHVPGHTA